MCTQADAFHKRTAATLLCLADVMPLLSKNRSMQKQGVQLGKDTSTKKNNNYSTVRLGFLWRTCRKFNFILSCQDFKLFVLKTERIFKCIRSATNLDFRRSRTQEISSDVCVSVTSHVHPQRLDVNYWKLIGSLWLSRLLLLSTFTDTAEFYFPFKYDWCK